MEMGIIMSERPSSGNYVRLKNCTIAKFIGVGHIYGSGELEVYRVIREGGEKNFIAPDWVVNHAEDVYTLLNRIVIKNAHSYRVLKKRQFEKLRTSDVVNMLRKDDCVVYGAVWGPSGLIYVARLVSVSSSVPWSWDLKGLTGIGGGM